MKRPLWAAALALAAPLSMAQDDRDSNVPWVCVPDDTGESWRCYRKGEAVPGSAAADDRPTGDSKDRARSPPATAASDPAATPEARSASERPQPEDPDAAPADDTRQAQARPADSHSADSPPINGPPVKRPPDTPPPERPAADRAATGDAEAAGSIEPAATGTDAEGQALADQPRDSASRAESAEDRTVSTPTSRRAAPQTGAAGAPAAAGADGDTRQADGPDAEFLSLDADRFTVQLAAMRHRRSLTVFFAEHPLARDSVWVTRAVRGGKHWWLVLYGSYDSAAQARAGARKLPESLRNQQPWVRRVGAVQRDVRQAQADSS